MVIATPMPEIMQALEEHEQAMSELYQAYAARFPEMDEFWSLLAMEEMIHADSVEFLLHKIEEGAAHAAQHQFKLAVIRNSSVYVREEIARANAVDLLPINALSIALSLEQAILERRFFEVFAEDSKEVASLLTGLQEGAQEHIHRVEEMWNTYRKLSPKLHQR